MDHRYTLKCKIVKLLVDNIKKKNQGDFWYGDAFLDTASKT